MYRPLAERHLQETSLSVLSDTPPLPCARICPFSACCCSPEVQSCRCQVEASASSIIKPAITPAAVTGVLHLHHAPHLALSMSTTAALLSTAQA